jgi:hypothetical protein
MGGGVGGNSQRPRVALQVSTRLFRDALVRVLDPHVEVVLAPDGAERSPAWADDQAPFDVAIVSEGVGAVGAGVVVELPCAEGGTPLGTAHGPGPGRHTVRSITELLELLPRPA